MLSANQIRQQFLEFFAQKHGHTIVPSGSVVPFDDPTLLFTNAGMNQFKDVFLGTGTRSFTRAVDTQKCIRAGGKHNDLDDVGKDTYHHTFFEMLGNWSFGDYFKKEAIAWAWELLTQVWGLDKSRLHATVFEGNKDEGLEPDTEAFELWKTVTDIDHSHIHWGNKKDNFWEMGETGPCGPCTEIHYDKTPDKSGGPLVNQGSADVIEIWNLVFIQFNRNADRTLTPLPAKHVDTGMGFERVTAVLHNKSSNYDTDVFAPIFDSLQKLTGADPYGGKLEDVKDVAYRVIGDHIRTLTFAITDGATPSNEGRGYVLRRILRRAERYGRQHFGTTKPFLCDMVATVVDAFAGPFPELKTNPKRVADIIRDEEEGFIRTLDRGIHLFQEAAQRARAEGANTISGADAFQLQDTFGLYIDITEQMAAEENLQVDRPGFETFLESAKEKSRQGSKKVEISALTGELPATDDSAKYKAIAVRAKILGWVKNNTVITQGKLPTGEDAALLVDKTCFYAEQGGQVGDQGIIRAGRAKFQVEDTQRLGDSVLHIGKVVTGTLKPGQNAVLEISPAREDIMRNHTATHLLNWALKRTLGDHVEQKGSLVDAQRTRFDFAHDQPLSAEEIAEVERRVNQKIYADLPVLAVSKPLAEAKQIAGVRAVFGEKYPDPVRVLIIGAKKSEEATLESSVEFCGGTHLSHTGQAGFFKIISQELVGKGVRRLTAVTGPEAVNAVQKQAHVIDELSGQFHCKPEEIPTRVSALQEEIKKLQQQLKKGSAIDLAGAADKLFESAEVFNGARIIVGTVPFSADEQVRNQIDRLRQKAGSAAIVVGCAEDGKVQLFAAVTEDLITRGLHAGNLIKQLAQIVGGGGGGRPNMAQAGGKDPAKLPEALEMAKQVIKERL